MLGGNKNIQITYSPDKITGIGVSLSKTLVRSLNCLQNSAIFKPSGPKACPT